jgi:hypothetical protein
MRLPPRFHRWPWKEPVDTEIDEELAFHREMRTRDLIARGMPPGEARHQVERQSGGATVSHRLWQRRFGGAPIVGREIRMNGAPYTVDGVTLAFTVVVAIASRLLAGLMPALRLARGDVQAGLHDGRRGSTAGGFRDRLRTGLMAGEVALSLVLLVGAGLLIRSAIAMQRVNPGFDPHGVFAARFSLPEQTYADPPHELATLQRISESARQRYRESRPQR